MRIYAFEGITYAPGSGDPGRLAAPPYDQIGEEAAAELHARDPHHFAWLSKPVPGAGGDRYREAARLHSAWLEAGVLARAARPELYPYAIDLPDGGRRLGLTAAAGLERPESGVIRPHEETLAKPLADRLALLRAMAVDLEPVLLLCEDAGELDRLLAEDLDGAGETARLLASHTDASGNRHRLYRLSDPARIGRYRACLAERPAAIADGHHRYKVALRYAEEEGLPVGAGGEEPPPAAAAKLAVVTSLASPALEIQPIHRALAADPGIEQAGALAAAREPVRPASGRELAAAVAAAGQPAIGVRLAGRAPEIWRLDPAAPAASALSPGARRLSVALLHGVLLPGLAVGDEAASGGAVRYPSDPEVLWRMVETGEAAVGIWLPPMDPADFAAAIAGGEMLPPKSTRFLPKVVSGLVWADHRGRLG